MSLPYPDTLDWEAIKAAVCIHRILWDYEWVTIAKLRELMLDTPDYVLYYLLQNCRGNNLSKFLQSYPNLFHVKGGTVIQHEVHKASQEAVQYFEDKLRDYESRPTISNFRGHIGQATKEVKKFIAKFYPDADFKKFFSSRPNVFVVYIDDTLALIEEESVTYFQEKLESYVGCVLYKNLRGHIGQATKHVQRYINDAYPGDSFLTFLQSNPRVFEVDDEGYVWLL